MTGGESYVVELIEDQQITARRGLAFLVYEEDKSINAKRVFNRLNSRANQYVRTGFDYWLGGTTNPKRFHGWEGAENRDCFVFKWKEGAQGHRFYGFLCHPLLGYPRFELCVLVSHATKSRRKTDPRELRRLNELRAKDAVKKAITEATKNLKPGTTKVG